MIVDTEQKSKDETFSRDVAIAWGKEETVPIPKGASWTGTYTRFDGKAQKFDGPYRDAFLKVSQSGSVLNILASPE